MERLTERDYEQNMIKGFLTVGLSDEDSSKLVADVDKLAEYEKLEEQGLLLRLPCKIGSTIYQIDYHEHTKDDGSTWKILSNDNAYVKPLKFALCHLSNIGILYFLTEDEAKETLNKK